MATNKVMVGSPSYHAIVSSRVNDLTYLMLNLPTTCSFRCRKCAIPARRQRVRAPLTAGERATLLQSARLAGMATLVVIGEGEPTENFHLTKETFRTAHDLGMNTILFSTLNGLDREQAEFYTSHDVSIFVSLDSLEPMTYQWLTGVGNLENILEKVRLLRDVYPGPAMIRSDTRLVRLGINTTVCAGNARELANIRDLAGGDMQFVANPPMRRGRLQAPRAWDRFVRGAGSSQCSYEDLVQLAESYSETGGHTSRFLGVCNYFSRGVSVAADGSFLTCGYASETAKALRGNAAAAGPDELRRVHERVQAAFRRYCEESGQAPSCPLRDPGFPRFVSHL